MKAIAIGTTANTRIERTDAEHAKYICHRVVDTLLREDARECVSRSALMPNAALPAGLGKSYSIYSGAVDAMVQIV